MRELVKDKLLKKIIGIFFRYKLFITLLLLFSFVFIGLNIIKPYILSLLFDNGIEKRSLDLVFLYTFFFFLIMVFSVGSSITHEYLVSNFANRFIYDIKVMFIEHILDLPSGFYDKNSTGDIITRINNDIEDIRNFLLFDITGFYQSILNFVGATIFIGFMQWKILVANLIVLPLLYFVLKYFRALLYNVSMEVKNSYSESNKELVEGFKNVNELKATNFELYFLKKQSKKFLDLLKKSIKSSVTNQTSTSSIQFVINLTYLITVGYGGYLIINGEMTTGILLAFLTMRSTLLSPVNAWSSLYTRYFSVKASIDRLNAYYEHEIESGLELPRFQNNLLQDKNVSLQLSNISFRYTENKTVFKDLSMNLNPGEWIGIRGSSGIGKTSLFRLILKLVKPAEGSLNFGKLTLSDINNRDWRELIGYVSQTTFALNESIKENIVMGREKIDERQIYDVLNVCSLYDEIEQLPEKLNTNIDEKGAIFSGGMLKRLMLARAIIVPKRFLLLDEFFSALDNDMSLKIMRNLKDYLTDYTSVLIISHRETDFKYCNKIIDMIKNDDKSTKVKYQAINNSIEILA